MARCNWELSERLKANRQSLMGMKMSDRVQTAIQWRLEMLIPYMSKAHYVDPAPSHAKLSYC